MKKKTSETKAAGVTSGYFALMHYPDGLVPVKDLLNTSGCIKRWTARAAAVRELKGWKADVRITIHAVGAGKSV